MANKKYRYDISETGCYTEFTRKKDVIDHFNMMCENDQKEVEGCNVYRQLYNVETLATYEIHFSKGRCKLVKV